jgi:putative acetyltransferase
MIRQVLPADFPAIRAIIRHAFDRVDEANLVEDLREDGDTLFELLACDNSQCFGHILYSRLRIERGETSLKAAALAPVSVLPAFQRRGVGAALIEAGNARCKELGCAAIVVLGHEDYYPRFGFAAAAASGLDAPFSGPSFMALELGPHVLAEGGRVHYARAFGLTS